MHHEPASDADKALLAAHYSEAEALYRSALSAHPGDSRLTAGLVHALLRDQKVQEASEVVTSAITASPQDATLITVRGEVEYRQGIPWAAVHSAAESEKLNPCNPRNMMLLADIARISSMYASAQKLIREAHQIDPQDPEIREDWLMTLPLKPRISELESYLQQPSGEDEDDIRHLHIFLEHWKKLRDDPPKPCRLVSNVTTTEVPMIKLMYDANHVKAFGLDVKLNDRHARLEIDTGAGGLLVTRAVAKHAGLQAFSKSEVSGIGSHGEKPGYTTYADSIRIGGLEFQNCAVQVLDSKQGLGDVDGLIGMDVLSRFLVTLDYPMRNIILGPLPLRPGESPATKPELETQEDWQAEPAAEDDSAQGKKQGAAPENQALGNDQPQKEADGGSHGPFDRYVPPEMNGYWKIYRVGHALIIPATLNSSQPRLFILDTGAWKTVVSSQAAREVTKLHADNSGMEVRGISGKVEKLFTADNITFHFANLAQKANGVVAFDTSNVSKNVGLEVSGFIGASTLDLLTIHIDYRDGLVKFEFDPNRGYRF